MATRTIPNHSHCTVCGKAIPPEDDYCTTECRNQHEQKMQKQKRMMYIMYGLLIVGIGLVLAPSLLGWQ